jgi:hypothetical protein
VTSPAPPQPKKRDFWDKLLDRWWACLLLGAIVLALTFYQCRDLHRFETGQDIHIPRRTKVLYDIGGKWLVGAIGGTFGLAIVALGVYQFVRPKPTPPPLPPKDNFR